MDETERQKLIHNIHECEDRHYRFVREEPMRRAAEVGPFKRENNQLTKQIQELKAELEEFKSRKKEPEDLEPKNEEADMEKIELQGGLENEVKKVSAKDKEAEELRYEIEELKVRNKDLEELRNDIEEMKAKNKEVELELEKTAQKLKIKENEVEELRTEFEEFKGKKRDIGNNLREDIKVGEVVRKKEAISEIMGGSAEGSNQSNKKVKKVAEKGVKNSMLKRFSSLRFSFNRG